ncbi:MAG: DNA repair protein RecN [Actinobacteria bacterium]|nr:DNA repair protein RecN [Actinomycetota bacterium]
MLREMRVRDLALIREAHLEFSPGLNVLTGETGAGKTVLVEALGLLLGGRGDIGMIRPGAERLELEAAFELRGNDGLRRYLEEEGLECEGEELILRRVLGGDGKGRCYVNDRMCTVGTLARIGEFLVDIHGQHEHQRLLRSAAHLQYLDDYGSPGHQERLRVYRALHARWHAAREGYLQAGMDEAERLREIDLLRYQVREIEAAGIREGEMEELLRERKRMQNREELFVAVRDAHRRLAGGEDGEGALDLLGEAESLLRKAAALDEELTARAGGVWEAQGVLSDIAHELHAYLDALAFEPSRLEEVEARLHELSRLARKYGERSGDILAYLERAKERLEELEGSEEKREALRREEEALRRELEEASSALSASRRALADELAKVTNRELSELNMGGVRFRVRVEEEEEFSVAGRDAVSFEISPGKDLPFRPVARIASGGELSRITLALKLALARADAVPTLVFDEIDAGIGGETADVLAEKLSRISRYHQVFTITHLPQIAAVSDVHLSVSKRQSRKGMVTEVRQLEGEERLRELVRMLGGDESTARQHALSMLERGSSLREKAS